MRFEQRVAQAAESVLASMENKGIRRPRWGMILGSGMGDVAEAIETELTLAYSAIPQFAPVAVAGHRGELIFGQFAGVDVVVMSGRYHFYEGHTIETITLPISVMSQLGVDRLLVSNAAGGVNPRLSVGDLVAIDDLICTWKGFGLSVSRDDSKSDGEPMPWALGSGRRSRLFDEDLMHRCQSGARELGFTVGRGCYHATTGPTYETRAEYRMMRTLGIDLVGMSTAAEVVHAAIACQMRVLALSMVSNVANPDRPALTDHDEVMEAGRIASVRMRKLVELILD